MSMQKLNATLLATLACSIAAVAACLPSTANARSVSGGARSMGTQIVKPTTTTRRAIVAPSVAEGRKPRPKPKPRCHWENGVYICTF